MVNLTWNEYQHYISILTDMIKVSSKEYHNIYGIPRGGLVLAVSLSHQLNLPLIVSDKDITANTLVCDDISDSGKTIINLRNKLNLSFDVTCLYKQIDTLYEPEFYCLLKHNEWIIFPWETNNIQDSVSNVIPQSKEI